MDRYHLGASWHNPKPPPPPEKNGRRAPLPPSASTDISQNRHYRFQKAFLFLSVCISVCLFVCLYNYLFVCFLAYFTSPCPSPFWWSCRYVSLLFMFLLCLSVCLSVWSLSISISISYVLCFLSSSVYVTASPYSLRTRLWSNPPSLRFAVAASSAGDSRASAATEPAPFIGVKSPSTDRRLITRSVPKTQRVISETDNI